MKRNILLLALLLATAFSAFAQIENEIMQSKMEKISKGRAYLLEKFLDRDYDKVKEIKDYLLGLEDDNYAAIAPVELWHILFWTEEFDALTTDIRSYDSIRFVAFKNKVKPVKDALGEQLYRRSVEDEHLLRFNLQEAQLSKEDFDFLTLFLDWDLKPDSPENQKSWNESVEKFLSDYPNSDYEWFVRHLIRKQYVENDWGIGAGIAFRSALTTGTLANHGLGMGIVFDVLYKRFDLTLGFGFMTLKTREDQIYSFQGTYGLVYPKGSDCNWTFPYADLSYYLFDGKRIAVGPLVGIGWIFEDYPYNDKKEDEYKDLNKNFFVCKLGLSFDFKVPNYGFDRSALRMKYEFGLTGFGAEQQSTVHMLTVGFSMIGRGTKRVY